MEGKSYELPDDITGLGGMVTWVDEAGQWNTEVFEFLADARYAFRKHRFRSESEAPAADLAAGFVALGCNDALDSAGEYAVQVSLIEFDLRF